MKQPSSKDPRQVQHAQKIAAERQLMEATGLTRQELRKSLRNGLVQFFRRVEAQRVPGLDNAPRREPPEVKTEEVVQKAEHHQGGLQQQPVGAGGGQQGTGGSLPIVLVFDGVLYYATADALLGAEVVV